MTFGLSWFFLGHLDLPFLVGSLQPPNNRSLPQRFRLFSFCGLVAFLAGAHCCCHIENLPDRRVPFRAGNPEEDTSPREDPREVLGSPRGLVEGTVSGARDLGKGIPCHCREVWMVPSRARGHEEVRCQKLKWLGLRTPPRSEFDSTYGLRTSQRGLPFWAPCCRYRIGNNRRGKETDVPSWLDLKLGFPTDTENTCWHCTFWKQTPKKNHFFIR